MKIIIKIICFIAMICMLLSLSACGDKKSISADEFIKKMKDNSYKTNDISDQYSDNSEIKSVVLGFNDDYQIEFYEYTSKSMASASFEKNREIFKDEEGSSVVKNSVEMGNHGFYESTTNGNYSCVSYIDNTMLFVKSSKENKKEIKSIIKKLGYNML